MITKDQVKSLDDQLLRLMVAGLVGFTDLKITARGLNGTFRGRDYVEIPDYPKDLNAMNELETGFLHNSDLLDRYYENLEDIGLWQGVLDTRSASARIRAESLVLTVGES